MAIYLKVEKVDGTIARAKLGSEPITFGRSQKASYTIDDDMASGIHVSIAIAKSKSIIFKDLGSTNGTFLNGAQLMKGEIRIGDSLSIGKTYIEIDVSSLSGKQKDLYAGKDLTSIKLGGVKSAQKSNTRSKLRIKEELDESAEEETPSIELNFDNDEEETNTPEESSSPDFSVETNEEEEEETKTKIDTSRIKPPTEEESEMFSVDQEQVEDSDDETITKKIASSDGYVSTGQTQFIQLETKKLDGHLGKRTGKVRKKKKKKPKTLMEKILSFLGINKKKKKKKKKKK